MPCLLVLLSENRYKILTVIPCAGTDPIIQVSSDEVSHQHTLQSGLSSQEWLADCLAVPKGRSLVLRSLSHLTPSRRTVLLTNLLGNLHLLAKGDKEDTKFWGVLAQHVALER